MVQDVTLPEHDERTLKSEIEHALAHTVNKTHVTFDANFPVLISKHRTRYENPKKAVYGQTVSHGYQWDKRL